MNAVKQPDHYKIIEDIYNLPEGKHAELIDGELYMMASPGNWFYERPQAVNSSVLKVRFAKE